MGISGWKRHKWIGCMVSAAIPALAMLLACAALQITPFGNRTLLVSDMSGQYVNFLSYFRTIISGSNDFFYTFSKNLGGDMVGLSAYYLFSPFNLVTLLFPTENLPTAVTLIITLKISFCGLTFFWFANSRSGFKTKPFSFGSIILSTAYALMAYNVAYCFNIMWLDGVILLPLIALGVERTVTLRRPLLHVLTLAAALASNYYTGFMLCIFSVLWAIYNLILAGRQPDGFKYTTKSFAAFSGASLLAVGIAAVVLLPALLSLRGGKADFSLFGLEFKPTFPFYALLAKFFTGAFNWDTVRRDLPNIYCGILSVIFVIQYFFNSKISVKEKLCSAGLIGLMWLSFSISAVNLVWHGFNPPTSFPFRYAFIFSFIIVYIAWRSYKNMDGINARKIICSICSFLALTASAFFIENDELTLKSLLFDGFFAVVCGIVLYVFYARTKPRALSRAEADPKRWPGMRSTGVLLLILLQTAGMGINSYLAASHLIGHYSDTVDAFGSAVVSTQAALDTIDDDSFYRLEKTFQRSHNDPMLFNYRGLSHFSSTEKTFVKAFMKKLGFKNHRNAWAFYRYGSTASADSLLGVKYMLTKNETGKPYENVATAGDITVYRNPYALPLGFAAERMPDADLDTENYFDVQNRIFNSLTSETPENIFNAAKVLSLSAVNLAETDAGTYAVIDPDKEAYLEYTIKAQSSDMLYGYLHSTADQAAEISVNGQPLGVYFTTYRWDIFPIGFFEPGDILHLKVKHLDVDPQTKEKNTETDLIVTGADFYHESIDTLSRHYTAFLDGFCDLTAVTSSRITGTVDVPENSRYLIFTIPFESAWHIRIDGDAAEPVMVFDTFMAVPVTPGPHTLDLRYIPDGLSLGGGITAGCLLIVAVWQYLMLRNKRLLR